MKESFLWNYQNGYMISITYVLLEFTRTFDYLFADFYPNSTEVLFEIKNSQQDMYGNFPFKWKIEHNGDIYDTCRALQIFHDSYSLSLLNETIIILHPPLSPFVELSKISSSFITHLSALLILSVFFIFYKKNKPTKLL